ncbi:MAG: hypothetical protein ACTTK1_02910 [Candidatus Cryptobacteroides sp.]
MFDPLTKADVREILHIQMKELADRLAQDGIEISFTENFEDYIVDKGYDPAYGARPVKRIIQKELVNQLAKSMLEGTVNKDSVIEVDVSGSNVVLKNK